MSDQLVYDETNYKRRKENMPINSQFSEVDTKTADVDIENVIKKIFLERSNTVNILIGRLEVEMMDELATIIHTKLIVFMFETFGVRANDFSVQITGSIRSTEKVLKITFTEKIADEIKKTINKPDLAKKQSALLKEIRKLINLMSEDNNVNYTFYLKLGYARTHLEELSVEQHFSTMSY